LHPDPGWPAAMIAHLTLTTETIRPLLHTLEALNSEAETRRVALLHDSGLVLAEAGAEAHLDQGESGALAAGTFFAARHLAQRLGESAFTGLHYQGAGRDFLMVAAGPEALLLIVFDNRTRPAIVRACLQKHLPAIEATAARLHAPPPAAPQPPPQDPPLTQPPWLPHSAPFQETDRLTHDRAAVFHA